MFKDKGTNLDKVFLLVEKKITCFSPGAAEKPYTVEDAVSYNELDYLSVSFSHLSMSIICCFHMIVTRFSWFSQTQNDLAAVLMENNISFVFHKAALLFSSRWALTSRR